MAVKRKAIGPGQFTGESTDTKPTRTLFKAGSTKHNPGDGATFYELDTGIMYITGDGETWVEKDTIVRLETVFGEPTLSSEGNGKAEWDRGTDLLGTNQKGTTGWVAKLTGGVQSGYDDAASVVIPVNELPVPYFTSALWTYYLHNDQAHGCNIGIHVHDPTDNDKRADINQSGAAIGLEKDEGWNAHELNVDTGSQFFYFAENEGSPGLTEGSDNLYSWAQFQADAVFSTWTIYKITINQGYYTGGGVFGDAIIGDIKLNGLTISLKPSKEQMWYSDHLIKNDIPISTSIYTPRRIHVTPVFTNYITVDGQGIGHLIKKANHGLDNQIGYAAMLGSTGAGTDVNTFAIPVNIPLNKIDTLTYLERMSNGVIKESLRGIYFRLDALRGGSYDPHDNTASDMYLGNDIQTITGSTDWTRVNPLSTTTFSLQRWHDRIATPDGTLDDSHYFTFDQYKATDIGDYYVKEIGIAYGGLAAGRYGILAGLCINGIEYIFDKPDNHIFKRYYTGSAGIASLAALLSPMTPFRLLSVSMHIDGVQGGASSFVLNLLSGGPHDTYFDVNLLTDDMYVPTTRTSLYVPFGEGYEFDAADEIDCVYTNTTSKNYGLIYTFEVL